MFAVAVLAVLVLSAAMPASADINLLENPGFETGLFDPWVTDAGGLSWQFTVQEEDSNHFAAILVGRADAWIYQNIGPPQCAQYLNFRYFGGWEPQFGGDMEVRIFYSDLTYHTEDLAISGTWTPVHIELDTAKLVTKVEAWVSAYAGGINVDDFDLEACPAAVGGVVIPANTVALVAPWLAVIGVVGCIGTIAIVAKKYR